MTFPFFDGFESGNYNNWTESGGSYTREVTNITAASGTYSFTQIGGSGGHRDGVYAGFDEAQSPNVISFSVRSSSTSNSDGYFALGQTGNCPIFCYMKQNGNIHINFNETFGYSANTWYDIRFEIDWVLHQLDFYVDDVLITENLPFRDNVDNFDVVNLYNYTYSQAWWDNISIGGSTADWLIATPISGTIPPGSSETIEVTFDATGLTPDVYTANINIASNDPDEPLVTVPVTLTVIEPQPDEQNIIIAEGWSGISSYIIPDDPAVENIFAPIVDELVILQNFDGMYFPFAGVNTIGNWGGHAGYQIKMNETSQVTFTGEVQTDLTIGLTAGWNYLPVLNSCNNLSVDLFSQIINNLQIVKEVAGWKVYWPQFGVTTLDEIIPGKVYFILVDDDVVVEFPGWARNPEDLPGLQDLLGLSPEYLTLKGKGGESRTSSLNSTQEPNGGLRGGTPLSFRLRFIHNSI